jgi:UDP-N-acetylglucosamine--dolichyl-phosphate N-acetylglucosaminephosphotransferase
MYLNPQIFNNTNYELALIFLYALFATWVAIKYVKEKSVKYSYVVEDKYKLKKTKIPIMGGLAMFAGIVIALALSVLLMSFSKDIGGLFIFYFVVIIYAMYGLADDMFGFKQRYDKIIILLVLSIPIGVLITNESINILGHELILGPIYPVLIAPIYIMVVANLLNVHSGFNGQSAGLSLILLIAIFIKSLMISGNTNMIYLMPILGAVIAFYPQTRFPAKMLEGNIGQFMVGAAIGALLIVNKLEIFGIFILLPHIINFVLDTWILFIKKVPDVKFGSVRKDGTIIAPKAVKFKSIKFIITHYFRLKEDEAVNIIYAITVLFCIIGVWLL